MYFTARRFFLSVRPRCSICDLCILRKESCTFALSTLSLPKSWSRRQLPDFKQRNNRTNKHTQTNKQTRKQTREHASKQATKQTRKQANNHANNKQARKQINKQIQQTNKQTNNARQHKATQQRNATSNTHMHLRLM